MATSRAFLFWRWGGSTGSEFFGLFFGLALGLDIPLHLVARDGGVMGGSAAVAAAFVSLARRAGHPCPNRSRLELPGWREISWPVAILAWLELLVPENQISWPVAI